MADGRVEFHGVWKKFRRGELHDSLRDLVPAVVRRLVAQSPSSALARNEFWAVRDVSFTVTPGQALGIIGPNGAGKSTVLKLLTRILRPTRGYRRVDGRIGSLIEVAAGFHPDLTGLENIYLQGAIMGMRRTDIRREFDAIVEFSELPDFIDTPVKRFSSGMNARLGFAIAVHLNPDVLIIDEVLAVGDYAFQHKAFERISEMTKRDIPVVIVSHQLERIAQLCSECLLLDRGGVVERGTPQACISRYVLGGLGAATGPDAPITVQRVELQTPVTIRSGEQVRLAVDGEVNTGREPGHTIVVAVRALRDSQVVFATTLAQEDVELPSAGPFHLDVNLQANLGRGLFAVETIVWHRRDRRELGRGPQVLFEVGEDPGFHGLVNLHARIHAGTKGSTGSGG